MDKATPYPSLFAPFTLADRPLRNRIVHASMNTHMAENTRVTERLIQYHANRARGGAALIVTEPISMARHQNVPYRARAWNDDNLDALKRWADAVESEDCPRRKRSRNSASSIAATAASSGGPWVAS